ncbi:hypothetical protein [Tengunoibacter tsumagoiensis]|uniref:Uncharacterized protein n=1 Tax=Tengunoibacter tsumagoiensis TaxID=2014871 RepID=A0A402A4V6_9CHLR|nr:hypothetical protein [Tengunoibacter tsumagoiensis]GCE14184.1 hypothetical protein KTT_40430 [Tengunoibacter tsumagoiensis]GCE14238.1 hypothetical protein KTT_40970 [Tengunoibacter tsumagoiensis]
MKYRYRLFCDDCTGDEHGCFGGGSELSEEIFDTTSEAFDAGHAATESCAPWGFIVTDEDGRAVVVDEDGKVVDDPDGYRRAMMHFFASFNLFNMDILKGRKGKQLFFLGQL